MGIRIREAEARAIDQLCEQMFILIENDKELTQEEASQKRLALESFVKIVLDQFEIVDSISVVDISLSQLIQSWHLKLHQTGSPIGTINDTLIFNDEMMKKLQEYSYPVKNTPYIPPQGITVTNIPVNVPGGISYSPIGIAGTTVTEHQYQLGNGMKIKYYQAKLGNTNDTMYSTTTSNNTASKNIQ